MISACLAESGIVTQNSSVRTLAVVFVTYGAAIRCRAGPGDDVNITVADESCESLEPL